MKVLNLGPDPSLVFRPELLPNTQKETSDFRNFEVK